ncbi:hypothetical protein K503DRAFT_777939 [Rhizopogon vinicolor AM-OR11-026]|uniref:CBM1 domain-containing protein n=1 Tax=Rhizopogon vinicolor AM-OR11-026 TaxID=1314800 RepID=A0A1B7MEC8_9AGAM|nr:hypothetical protein K503DRAFT_777939 [Rhizopogon vinicolor AM-OR11-026]
MHFSIFTIVVTLTAAISVSACYGQYQSCKVQSDCCVADNLICDTYEGVCDIINH